MPKGKRSNLNVTETWIEYFEQNEKDFADDQATPLTDEQITEAMRDEFSERASAKIWDRVAMQRSCYNRGTSPFSGVAGQGGKVVSRRFDADGKVWTKPAKPLKEPGGKESSDARKLSSEKDAKPASATPAKKGAPSDVAAKAKAGESKKKKTSKSDRQMSDDEAVKDDGGKEVLKRQPSLKTPAKMKTKKIKKTAAKASKANVEA
tara:strand:+ start:44 stop:661 length:618 start_codon:yes stop_codon:yes gene_type:complete